MMVMAGRLGYSEEQFWAMSPRFFYNASVGEIFRQRDAWEIARFGYFFSAAAPHLKMKGRMDPYEFFPLSWEAEKVAAAKAARQKALVDKLKPAWDKWMQELEAKKNAEHGSSKP